MTLQNQPSQVLKIQVWPSVLRARQHVDHCQPHLAERARVMSGL